MCIIHVIKYIYVNIVCYEQIFATILLDVLYVYNLNRRNHLKEFCNFIKYLAKFIHLNAKEKSKCQLKSE